MKTPRPRHLRAVQPIETPTHEQIDLNTGIDVDDEWMLRPTLSSANILTQEKLMLAGREFAKFDIIGKDFDVRVVPYRRVGMYDTLVQQINGLDIATLLHVDKIRKSNMATIPLAHFTAAVCQYLYNTKNSDSEMILCDLARPSQFVHDTNTNITWLVDVEPRLMKNNLDTRKNMINQLIRNTETQLMSTNTTVVQARNMLNYIRERP